MTFTIPPFWCGVLATVIGEFLATVVYSVIKKTKNKRGDKNEK